MKKICIVTATRAEYGLLRWVIDGVHKDPELELQLVVTGAHLLEEQGYTYRFIEEDGYPIAAKVDMHLVSDSIKGIVESMGYCSIGMAETFDNLKPDMLVVLGDRYELLSVVGAALVSGIPVAHISGGDVTEGAIDNEVRNALTMMSSLHFAGVQSSADNIERMRGNAKNVFNVGEPGLESFIRMELMSREELAESLGLDINKRWCLVTLHPETRCGLEENTAMAERLFAAMESHQDVQYVISKANADYGGKQINDFWEAAVAGKESQFKLLPSLGQRRYLSYMHQADGVLGNSSSGIIEAPFLGIPVVNIGDRQKGRYQCKNIIQCGRTFDEIRDAVDKMLHQPKMVDNYFGDGHVSEKIVAHIKEYLNEK